MKAIVVYPSLDQLSDEDRVEVERGKVFFSTPDLYSPVHTHDFGTSLGEEDACEEMFMLLNMDDGLHSRLGVRSMTVGDVVVVMTDDGRSEPYVCARNGFESVAHHPRCGSWLEIALEGAD